MYFFVQFFFVAEISALALRCGFLKDKLFLQKLNEKAKKKTQNFCQQKKIVQRS